MSNKSKKLKPLDKLRFDTVGDEFVYLYEIIHSKDISKLSEEKEVKEEPVKIESLREEYGRLVNEQNIREKYSKKSIYWSEEQEKSISEYIKEKDFDKKNLIFRKNLYQPFKKLIENIIFTYKLFRNDVDVPELQADCMSFLVTKIDKFNPSNGTKSFAYFGTIAKHYLMGEKKNLYKIQKINVDIDETSEEVGSKNFYTIDEDKNTEYSNGLFSGIIDSLEDEIENNTKMLQNDRKVADAIVFIFRNHELLDVYNKKLVYHLLKERTCLQTKEITYSLSRLKSFYKLFKEDFLKEDN